MRESVRKFAEEMERRLAANDKKGGWKDSDPDWLVAMAETNIRTYDHGNSVAEERPSLVDAANYLMMAWENLPAFDMSHKKP